METKPSLDYLAGYFDGEGTICVLSEAILADRQQCYEQMALLNKRGVA